MSWNPMLLGTNCPPVPRVSPVGKCSVPVLFGSGNRSLEDVYVIEGNLMNREYNLTGDNAYPETDCTILCIKLDDMERPMAVTLPRFAVGGRWFDDVVDNNARREAEKNDCEG